MTKPVGGRGKKAPYETVVIQVPLVLATEFERVSDEYRDLVLNGKLDASTDFSTISIEMSKALGSCSLQRFQAISEAKKILAQKKSAGISLKKLLQVLYNDEKISLED